MKYAVLAAFFAGLCCADQPRKPACTAQNSGQFWPQEANADAHAARRLYGSGELEMCTLVVWKYRWEHLSVNISQLRVKHAPASEDHSRESTIVIAGH